MPAFRYFSSIIADGQSLAALIFLFLAASLVGIKIIDIDNEICPLPLVPITCTRWGSCLMDGTRMVSIIPLGSRIDSGIDSGIIGADCCGLGSVLEPARGCLRAGFSPSAARCLGKWIIYCSHPHVQD